MTAIVNSFFLVYAALFPIVNPIGGAPIFLGLTRYQPTAARHQIALRVAINGFFLLVGSLFVGSYVLEFFGITLPIVRIAGGLVVTAFGWRMLHSGDVIDTPDPETAQATKALGVADAFYPLTMPLTVGPGSIAVAITLGSQRPLGAEKDFVATLPAAAGALLGLAAISLTVYICYRYAEGVVNILGEGGTNVLVRLSAFILLCIGIAIVWNGWSTLNAAGT